MLGNAIVVLGATMKQSYTDWLTVFMIIAIINIVFFTVGIYLLIAIKNPFLYKLFTYVKGAIGNVYTLLWNKVLDKYISFTGFSYDREQDIFYSNLDAWQRKFGYCRLYDEASAPTGMIVDCEPVYFPYNNKRWLIEFWKGQYDLTTGFEMGVYNTDQKDLNIPDLFAGTFYESAQNDELLNMSCTLLKNGKVLFKRSEKHWWLTGFKLGEFSNPSELVMYIRIEFLDQTMRNEFVKGLLNLKYSEREIQVSGNSVSFVFDKPHSPQPYTRTREIEAITQWKNKFLCDVYNDLTKNLKGTPQKVRSIRKKETEMFQKFKDLGKTKKTSEIYKTIRPYLG